MFDFMLVTTHSRRSIQVITSVLLLASHSNHSHLLQTLPGNKLCHNSLVNEVRAIILSVKAQFTGEPGITTPSMGIIHIQLTEIRKV